MITIHPPRRGKGGMNGNMRTVGINDGNLHGSDLDFVLNSIPMTMASSLARSTGPF